MNFQEIATSNPNLKIHTHIFQYNSTLENSLSLSDEIGDFKWLGKDDDESILSNSLKDEIISYCKKKKLIY